MALLDNSTQINTITPGFIENHSLDVGLLFDLMSRWVTCTGLWNTFTWPIGYIIIHVQVYVVQGYDEDQITLIVPDLSSFVAWVSVILGIPTIGHVMNMIREREIDALVIPWVNAWVAYIFPVQWATATVEDDKVTTGIWTLLNMIK